MRRVSVLEFQRQNKKIVVIMGPTGCGKTKLSLDLASRFFPSSEIINSDKIQVHRGLDITTNKIPLPDRRNVAHHLLGEFESSESHPEFTPSDFRRSASLLVSQIHSRRNTPFLVGGSNSFIYALLAKRFNPEWDVFGSKSLICRGLRYRCCFIWVDVSPPVLREYLVRRVDEMLESGMVEELAAYFGGGRPGLRGAIGVPEFKKYFERPHADVADYQEAVRAIKHNTCQLANTQLRKILRLRDSAGWDLNRLDATPALRTPDLWETQVVRPSLNIVSRFLLHD